MKKTTEKDPKKFLPQEQLDNYREIKVGHLFDAVEFAEIDGKKVRMIAITIINGKMYKFVFKTTRVMMCVKTVMIWRSILDMFTLQDMEKDKRNIYYNAFHGFGLKVPQPYRPLSGYGRTGIKLWHQIKGHTHRVWCGDQHAFPVAVKKESLAELYTQYHMGSYKVSDVVKDIEIGGEEAKQISFEVPNKDVMVEVLSQIVYKNGKIFSVSQKATNMDPAVEFFFVDFPLLAYEKAKEIADKICEGLEPEPLIKQSEKEKKSTKPFCL